jgi:hypothetical protein
LGVEGASCFCIQTAQNLSRKRLVGCCMWASSLLNDSNRTATTKDDAQCDPVGHEQVPGIPEEQLALAPLGGSQQSEA